MKKYKLALVLTTAVILISFLLAGCGGVPQAQYDQVADQLKDAQAQTTQLQGEITDLQAQRDEANAALDTA